MAYVAFAWLPTILVDLGGVTPATAGFLLSLFALVGLPCSMLVPVLVVRFQATRPLFFVAVVAGLVGLGGLLLFPTVALPLWVAIFGLTAIMFPLSLVLLSIRARTPESAVALSGFVQSIGYAIAAVFRSSSAFCTTPAAGGRCRFSWWRGCWSSRCRRGSSPVAAARSRTSGSGVTAAGDDRCQSARRCGAAAPVRSDALSSEKRAAWRSSALYGDM